MIIRKIFSLAASIISLFIFILFLSSNSISDENNIKHYSSDEGILSLMYHRFNENKYPSTNIQMDVFKEHMEIIKNSNYSFSNPKNFVADFGHLNRAFSAWKWYKRVFLGYVFNQFNGNTMLNCCTTCISWEIGSYNTQQSRHTEHTHFCRNFVAKSATWFSENEGGGQRPFGTFPKIHQFWRRHPSLIDLFRCILSPCW